MNNTCTAVKCNVTVAGYKPCLLVVLVLNVGEEGLVLGVLKVSTLVLLDYFVLTFFEKTADKSLGKNIVAVLSLDLYVVCIGVDTECNV